MSEIFTNCRICGERCGLAVTVDEGRIVKIGPDKQNPLSWRDFCVKGRSSGELLDHPRRVVAPMRRVGDRYLTASYEDAFDEISSVLADVIKRGGPDAVACYYGSPAGFDWTGLSALLRFMRGIGSASLFNWGSIDTKAKVVVSGEMYGLTTLPLIPDVDDCDCFFLIGTNPAESKMVWITAVPDGWRRILNRVAEGADLMVLDPYRTPTAAAATTHFSPVPGEDWAFLLGMLRVIFDNGWEDRDACMAEHGVEEVRRLTAHTTVDGLARRAGVTPSDIESAATRFAHARSAMALVRTGVSMTSRGTLGLWLAEVLNIVTGNWDRPGSRYFQPGITPPRLPAYENNSHRSRVAGRPAIDGCHSLAELPGEIQTPGWGQIRALFIQGGNPVVSGPESEALAAALGDLELLVAVDVVQRESHRLADWLIPATHWLERDDFNPYLSVSQELPFAQFTPKVVEPPADVRSESDFYAALGAAMSLPGYESEWDPRQTENAWRRAVERGGRTSWEEILAHPHGILLGNKEFGHARGMLRTPEQRIQLAPPPFVAEARRQLDTPPPSAPPGLPFRLGNRRRLSSMNSFLNDLPSTRRLVATNRVEIHRDDAVTVGVADGDRVIVRSSVGAVELEAAVTDAPRPGVVVIEHGWGSRVFDPTGVNEPYVLGVNRNVLTARTEEDPLSLMTAFNETWVSVEVAPPTSVADEV